MKTLCPVVLLPLLALAASPVLGAWSPDFDLTRNLATASSPNLTFTPDGTLRCVHIGQTSVGGTDHAYYTARSGGAWTAVAQIPSPGHKLPGVSVAAGPDNNVHVVGIKRVDGTLNTPYTVYYWEFNGTSWSGPVQLSDGLG